MLQERRCRTFLCRNLLQPCIRNTGTGGDYAAATMPGQRPVRGVPQVCIDLSIVDNSFQFKLAKREFIHFFNHTEFFILRHIFPHPRSHRFSLYLLIYSTPQLLISKPQHTSHRNLLSQLPNHDKHPMNTTNSF